MKKYLALLSIIVLFFCSDDSLSLSIFSNINIQFIILIVYIIISAFLLIYFKNREIKSYLVFLIFFLIISLTAIANFDFTLGYVFQILVIFTGYIVSTKLDFEIFVAKYCKILYYISLISIIFFTLLTIFPSSITFLPVNTNSEDLNYINIFVYIHYINMYRNTGIFREPGMYMIYLNFGILFQYYYYNTVNKKYLIVYIIALILTLSSAGFIVFSILSLLYIFKEKKIKTLIKFIFFSTILFIIVSNNFDLFENSLTKFDTSSNEHGSFIARISSISIPISIFMDSPIFGVGLTKFLELYSIHSQRILGYVLKADGHSTNTLFNSLATYGVFYFLIIIISLYKFSYNLSKDTFVRIGIFLSIILMLGNEDLRYSLLFVILIFYGSKRVKKYGK